MDNLFLYEDENIDYVQKTREIVYALDATCSEWMLLVYGFELSCVYSALVAMLETLKGKYMVMYNGYAALRIANINCKINGYSERWIMQCRCCCPALDHH